MAENIEEVVTTELDRLGITPAEFQAAIDAAAPPGWLPPFELPLRVLRDLPARAGATVFTAALRRELAFAWRHNSPPRA